MAFKLSTKGNGETVIVANRGEGKVKRTFPSRQQALAWYNNFLRDGTIRE